MRKSLILRVFGILLVSLLLALSAAAQDVSVRNKPYKGEIRGRGLEMLVRLDEIARALDMPAVQAEAGWTLNGAAVPTTEENGIVYLKLSDLEAAGAKVTLNKDFNTIDINRPTARIAEAPPAPPRPNHTNAPVAYTGGRGWTMVHWGATW
jgi:hypothetical protein